MQAGLEFYIVTGTQSQATMLVEPASLPTESSPELWLHSFRSSLSGERCTVFRGAEPTTAVLQQNSGVLAQGAVGHL